MTENPDASKTAADRAGEIHTSATGAAGAEPCVSGRTHRGGRHRRFGEKHAALFAEALAGNWRLPAAFHGMEFFAAREIGNAAGETAAVADAGDLFAAARGGLCGPLRTADHAAAAGRLSGAGGSVHLHGVCARRGARLPAAMAAELVPIRQHQIIALQ